MAPDTMVGGGFYNLHSGQQEEASEAGVAMLEQAVADLPDPLQRPLVVADLGSSEGLNSLLPLRAAIARLRACPGAADIPIVVVHTDLPGNDFSSLFDTVATAPGSYAGPGVFTLPLGGPSTIGSSRTRP